MHQLFVGRRALRAPKLCATSALLAILMPSICVGARAETLRVPMDFETIQAAIDAAVAGDAIVVSNGTYGGSGNRDLDFHGKAIALRSAHGPRKCVIDSGGSAGQRHRAFYFHSQEDQNTVVEGFTIIGGFADQHGGAVRCIGASPTFRNCIFKSNSAMGPGMGNLHGLASYWAFDEGQADFGADAGVGNNAAIEDAEWITGFDGSGLWLGGTSCASAPPHPAYELPTGFTLSAWLAPNYAFEGLSTLAASGDRFLLGIKKGHLYAKIQSADGDFFHIWGASLLPQGQWAHAALVLDSHADSRRATLAEFTGLRRELPQSILAAAPQGGWDRYIREIGNVLYDEHEPDPAKRYKLYYSGYAAPYTGNNVYVGWAYSADGVSWTKAGKVHSRALEDPYVVQHDGVYYLFAEDKVDVPFRNIRLLTSSDGVEWSDEGDVLDIREGGTPYNWESSDVSSPVVWVEDDTWYMLYEGRGGGLSGRVGLARSPNGRFWIRTSGSPVFVNGAPGEWDETSVVGDDITKIDGTYYFFYHGFGRSQTSGWWSGMATSTDRLNWTRYPANPISVSESVMVLNDNGQTKLFVVNPDESGISRFAPYVISSAHLYLNGVEDRYWQRDDTDDQWIRSETTGILLGCDPHDSRRNYVGGLDDVRLYPRAMSAAELRNPAAGFAAPMGGAVHCEAGSAPMFINCVFVQNETASAGGAAFADSSSNARFINCTVTENVVHSGRGGGLFFQSEGEVTNSIVWGNAAPVVPVEIAGPAQVTFSDVGEASGESNIQADPMFVDPGRGDFRLRQNSQCINRGAGMNLSPVDLDGHERAMCGEIDLGAYEYGAGDPNCDRLINLVDFEEHVRCATDPDSGALDPSCKRADIDNDGDVDLSDYAVMQFLFSVAPD